MQQYENGNDCHSHLFFDSVLWRSQKNIEPIKTNKKNKMKKMGKQIINFSTDYCLTSRSKCQIEYELVYGYVGVERLPICRRSQIRRKTQSNRNFIDDNRIFLR